MIHHRITSAIEHLRSERKQVTAYVAVLGILTIVFGTIYAAVQQDIRQSANDPQIQIAEDVAHLLNTGANPLAMVPPQKMDMSQGLDPFLVIYDASGTPIASSALLNNTIPVPPHGVFDYAKKYGEDRITWQPEPGVRIATVIVPYNNGFVLAGRSLREVEKREDNIEHLAGLGWLASIVLLGLFGYVRSRLE